MGDGQCRQMVYVGRVEGLYVWRRGGWHPENGQYGWKKKTIANKFNKSAL